MNLIIEIPEELAKVLEARAEAQGLSPDRYVSRLLHSTLVPESKQAQCDKPFETGYGMWARYGPAPSAEEIDQNRREMFRNFATDL